MNAPNHVTHVSLKQELPEEPKGDIDGRPDLPTPSLWQKGTGVTHKVSGRKAVVQTVDYAMRMFRAYYPDTGKFADKTEWENFDAWQPDVTFSPEELERQASVTEYRRALEMLDVDDLDDAQVFCQDADPKVSLAKLRMAIRRGMFTSVQAAVTDTKARKRKGDGE